MSMKWIVSEGYETAKPTRTYKNVGYKTRKGRRTDRKKHRKFWDFIKANPKGTD